MGFINFGSRIKNRQFDYIPRYYDPDKEELEERLKRYNRIGNDTELAKERIKGNFQRKYRGGKSVGNSSKRSTITLLVTIVMLCLLTYILLTRYLPQIISALE